MNVNLDESSDEEVLGIVLAEIAKAKSEHRCAKQDLNKIDGRLSFVLMLLNDRKRKKRKENLGD